MFSWIRSIKKGAWGAFPAVPAFVLVMLLRKLGVEVTELEAIELYGFVVAVSGFLIHGGKNVAKNRPQSVKASESEVVEDRRRA